MKKNLIFILLLSSSMINSYAQGTTGFELLRSEISPRGAAMAGALVGFESQIDALFYNPAGLSSVENRQVNVTYLNHMMDIESGFIAYGHRYHEWGVFGVGINYINYGEFQEATAYGELTGETFGAHDFLLTMGYGRRMNKLLALGLNVKYIHSSIWNRSSSAYAFDIGGLVYTPFDNTKIGFGIFNIGQTLSGFYDYKDKLPLGYKIGLSKQLAHLPLEFGIQAEKFQDSDIYFSAGGEFTLSEMFQLRLGWTTRSGEQHVDSDNDIFAGLSAGLGFKTSGVLVDYSYTSWGELGSLTRFSIGGVF